MLIFFKDGVLTISEKELNDIFGPVYQAPGQTTKIQ